MMLSLPRVPDRQGGAARRQARAVPRALRDDRLAARRRRRRAASRSRRPISPADEAMDTLRLSFRQSPGRSRAGDVCIGVATPLVFDLAAGQQLVVRAPSASTCGSRRADRRPCRHVPVPAHHRRRARSSSRAAGARSAISDATASVFGRLVRRARGHRARRRRPTPRPDAADRGPSLDAAGRGAEPVGDARPGRRGRTWRQPACAQPNELRAHRAVLGEEAPVPAIFAVAHREVAVHPTRDRRARSRGCARSASGSHDVEARHRRRRPSTCRGSGGGSAPRAPASRRAATPSPCPTCCTSTRWS